MAVEYDLVVIGGSTAAVYAAVAAAHLQARVALVEPHQVMKNWLGTGFIHSKALNQVARVAHHLGEAHQFGVFWETESDAQPRFTQACEWANSVVSTLEDVHSPAILASLGIDFIAGNGEFCRLPHFAFVVNSRHLRARAYLIATGSRLVIPEIEGLADIGYLEPADIWQQPVSLEYSHPSWVIIGGGCVGIELAQTLVRLGVNVTLVVSDSHILPKEDPDVSLLLQAQLEAEGVRVCTQAEVKQVKRIENKKWVLVGNKAIEADEVILATFGQPNIENLNLEAVGVKLNRAGIQLNEKLQTTNPRIYACGDVFGGYQFAHIADYEARIALKNALFLPIFKVDYRSIPWAIFSDPMLARVGLTEAEAMRRYGKEVLVLRQYFKTVNRAVLMGETTGLCKIVVRRNGEILGASIVGPEGGELIHILALAMHQRLKVSAIAQPTISPSLSEIIYQTAAEWHRQRLSSNTLLKDLLESFFNLRRSWRS